jgi:type I restriction enzyme S subunit
MGSNGAIGLHNEYLIKGPAIIVGRKGSAGRVVYEERDCYPIDTTFYIAHDPKKTVLRFIQFILLELKLEEEAKALGVPGLNRNDVYRKFVPLPPLKVQQRIVTDIESLEKKAETYVIKDLEEQRRRILLDGLK